MHMKTQPVLSPAIPRYALYGDPQSQSAAGMMHVERIRLRSSAYHFTIEPHAHDGLMQLLLLEAGGGEADIDGQIWHLDHTSIVLVPARCVHAFRFSGDTDGIVVTAAQRPIEALAAAAVPHLLDALRTPVVLAAPLEGTDRTALAAALAAVAAETACGHAGPFAAPGYLMLAALAQVGRIAARQQPQPSGHRNRRIATVERFRAMIEQRFRKPLQIVVMAGELGITAGQLTRLCRQTLGRSSRQLINDRIIQEAERELIYTDLSVKQIAAGLGFADDAYFGRFFRQKAGATPTAFRKTVRMRLAHDAEGA